MYADIIYFLACEVNQRQGDFMDEYILNKSCVIYLLTNKINSMKYVGKTTQKLKIRMWAHKNHNEYYLGRAIKKYGWENFKIEIPDECTTEYVDAPLSEEVRLREAKEKRKKVICVETGVIYLSIRDAKQKTGIDIKYISRVCNGTRKIGGGYHWKFVDEESLQKTKSKKLSNMKKAVRCIETNTIYDCINEAARQTGINRNYIQRACTGERKSGGGYHWEFVK